MWSSTARLRSVALLLKQYVNRAGSAKALGNNLISVDIRAHQHIALRHACSGTGNMGSDTHFDSLERPVLVDSRDPLKHPLASLSTEEMQQRHEYWKKVQSINRPPVYEKKVDENGEAFAIGSRKRSRAKVWIRNGTGQIVVNDRPWVDFFYRLDLRDKILHPFGLVGLMGQMDVRCRVDGGGPKGQAEAVRHAVARALQNWDPTFRSVLKSNGLLTRDSREVESKKYGRKKARKAFQWVKR